MWRCHDWLCHCVAMPQLARATAEMQPTTNQPVQTRKRPNLPNQTENWVFTRRQNADGSPPETPGGTAQPMRRRPDACSKKNSVHDRRAQVLRRCAGTRLKRSKHRRSEEAPRITRLICMLAEKRHAARPSTRREHRRCATPLACPARPNSHADSGAHSMSTGGGAPRRPSLASTPRNQSAPIAPLKMAQMDPNRRPSGHPGAF